jgi:Tfp pilus assembly protein PilO
MVHLTRENWIVLGVLGAIVTAATVFLYIPQGQKLDELRGQIAAAEASLESDGQKVAVVPDMVKQVQEMKARYKDFDRKLPKRKELGGFLREITGNLAEEKLANQSIEPATNTIREEFFQTLPIVMKFRGSYLSLASFLRRIDEMQRLSRIQKLKIEANSRDGEALDIELQMNIYFTES